MINLINDLITLIKVVIIVALGITALPFLAVTMALGSVMILVLTLDTHIGGSYEYRSYRK